MVAPFLPTITCPEGDDIHKLRLTVEGWRILYKALRYFSLTQITGAGDEIEPTHDQIRWTCLAQLLDDMFPWPDCRLWEDEIVRCFETWDDCQDARRLRADQLARAATATEPRHHRLRLHAPHFHLGDRHKLAA